MFIAPENPGNILKFRPNWFLESLAIFMEVLQCFDTVGWAAVRVFD